MFGSLNKKPASVWDRTEKPFPPSPLPPTPHSPWVGLRLSWIPPREGDYCGMQSTEPKLMHPDHLAADFLYRCLYLIFLHTLCFAITHFTYSDIVFKPIDWIKCDASTIFISLIFAVSKSLPNFWSSMKKVVKVKKCTSQHRRYRRYATASKQEDSHPQT